MRSRLISVLVSAVVGVALLPVVAAAAAVAPTTTPTITSPTAGAVIDTPAVTVKATSSASFVQFDYSPNVGGVSSTVAVVSGKASVSIDVVGLGASLWVTATDCSAVGICSDTNTGTSWVVDLPDPTIDSPVPNQVVGTEVVVQATAPGGGVAFRLDGRSKAIDIDAPYEATLSLASKADGTHDVLIVQCNADGTVCEGDSDFVKVIKDTVGPSWSTPKSSRPAVYPKDDQYLDVVGLSVRVSESVFGAKVEIRKIEGPIVRTLGIGDRRSGEVSRNWDGRNDAGSIVRDGRYEFRFVGSDVHGVAGVSDRGIVRVSGDELVRKTYTKAVTAAGSGLADISGRCSRVQRTSRWPGALAWRSNYARTCSGADSVAASVHGVRLDKLDMAVRFVSLKVSAYGGQAPGTRSQATMFYLKPSGDVAAQHALEGRVRWHAGDRTALEPYVNRTRVRWVVAARNGNSYDVKGFKVQYTVTVLQ